MRFHIGPVPEDSDFDPEADGWTRLREPRAGLLLVASIPLGMMMAAASLLAWSRIVHLGLPADSFSITVPLSGLLTAVAGLIGLIFLHELLHALPTVVTGSLGGVVIGYWPRHFAPYVAYTGALSREAQLVSGATPFVVLTLLPFAVALVFPGSARWMAALSILNTLGSAADLLMLGLLVQRIPRGALVRNHGFATWWRSAV